MAKHHSTDILNSNIETVLASDINFKGKLKFRKSLKINGNLDGEIDASEGHLIIGENAHVKANIIASRLSNYGKINGNVDISYSLEIYNKAMLKGDIKTNEFFIQKGGYFNGKCEMNGEW